MKNNNVYARDMLARVRRRSGVENNMLRITLCACGSASQAQASLSRNGSVATYGGKMRACRAALGV